jgi:hypothetical protein
MQREYIANILSKPLDMEPYRKTDMKRITKQDASSGDCATCPFFRASWVRFSVGCSVFS